MTTPSPTHLTPSQRVIATVAKVVATEVATAIVKERARTERLLAALREAGETAFRALNGQRGEVLTTAYREAVGRLMVEWCREHGESAEIIAIFEGESGS